MRNKETQIDKIRTRKKDERTKKNAPLYLLAPQPSSSSSASQFDLVSPDTVAIETPNGNALGQKRKATAETFNASKTLKKAVS